MCSVRCKNHGCRQKIPEGTSSAMFDVRTIAKCCEFKRCTSTRFDVTRVTQVLVFITINTGVFLGKICSDQPKNQKPPALLYLRSGPAAKYCELKRCVDPVRSTEPTTKMKSLKVTYYKLFAFLKRQLSTLLNSFFPFIVSWYFSQVLNFTSVELNRFAKQAKLLKNLFFKSDGGHAISRQEKRRLPKSTSRFPAKKRWHSPPPVGLSCDSSPPSPESVRTDVRWRHKQNFSDRSFTKFP